MKQSLKHTSIGDWTRQVIKTFRIIEEWGCSGSKGWEPYVSFIDNIRSFSRALGLDSLQHLTYMQRGSLKKEFETFVRTYAHNHPSHSIPNFPKREGHEAW